MFTFRVCSRQPLSYPYRLVSTINNNEINKFRGIGKEWWNAESPLGTGPLHSMNPLRIEFIRKSLSERLGTSAMPVSDQIKGLRILDVGCGGGLASEALARLGAIVTAIDPSSENILVARDHCQYDPLTANIDYRQSTIEQLSEAGEKFDGIVCLEVLEHVDNVKLFLQNCRQCLLPSGDIFLSTINRTTQSYATTILGAEFLLRILPIGTHDWYKFITPDELKSYIFASGFKDVHFCGLKLTIDSPITGLLKTLSRSSGHQNYSTTDDLRSGSVGARGGLLHWELDKYALDVNYIMHARPA